MTDNGERNGDGWLPGESAGSESRTDDTRSEDNTDHFTRKEWEKLASDPQSEENLGYKLCEWEEFRTLDDSDAIMFLPSDENVLRDDSFVVAEKDAVVDLGKWY